jgi:hypothetical protein
MSEAITKDQAISKANRLERLAKKGQQMNEELVGSALACLGGAGAGVLDAKYPSIRGTMVSGGIAAGGASIIAGLMNWAGKNSAQLVEIGRGMVGGSIAIKTHQHWLAKQK